MAEKKKADAQGDNLRFYEQLRSVPSYALKAIGAGRLKGMSDINPVYRIKAMTEAFGPCGIGWKYVITKQWLETYGQEVKAFTNIDLYIKVDGEWSDAIPGTGGSSMVAMERSGAYVSDEAYKMALTDALSVAMKSLGVAADVYYSKDKAGQFDTKYDQQSYVAQQTAKQQAQTVAGGAATVLQQSGQQAGAKNAVVSEAQYKAEIAACASMDALMAVWQKYPQMQQDKGFRDAWAARRGQVEKK